MQSSAILPSAIACPRPGETPGKLFAIDRRDLAIGTALLVFWAFCNPYYAVDASNLIYAARAFADLDPAGVGRDVMFLNDGQSGFTVFTWIMRELAAGLGLARASWLVSVAAMLAGFAAAFVLASTIGRGRTRYLIVVFAAALPAEYGGYKLFSYAEVAATPRPFAEALVLCGLAALVGRRPALATILVALAAALHPIMAASGAAVLVLWLAMDDRRWLAVFGVLVLAVVVLAICAIPPFDRLGTIVDPQWAAILKARNPHLFPSLWPAGWIGRAAARIATLVIAANLAPARVRRLFLLTVVVGLSGFAAAYLLDERVGSLLVLQVQTWRMMWLVFALATAGAAICVIELWSRGGTARIALGFLALAWVYADVDVAAAVFALVAVGVFYALDPNDYAAFKTPIAWVVATIAAWVCYGLLQTQLDMLGVTSNAPDGLAGEARRTIAQAFDYVPVAAIVAVWAVRGAPRIGPLSLGVAAAIGGLVLFGGWDQRSAANIYFDSGGGAPDLARLVATRPGEVYWIDGGRKAWWWLHRPQWLSPIQGAGIVFSRNLALIYKARAARAIAAGLADPAVMAPLAAPSAARPAVITQAALAPFCAEPDAPAWIIAPLVEGSRPRANVYWTAWTAPITELEPIAGDGGYLWRQVSRYAVIACAK